MSLSKQLAAAQSRMAEISDEIEAVGAAAAADNRELSEADSEIIDKLSTEFDDVAKVAERLSSAVAASERAKQQQQRSLELIEAENGGSAGGMSTFGTSPVNALPARVRSIRSKVYDNTADCYAVGMWMAGILGNKNAKDWCTSQGLSFKNAMEGGTDTLGGFTVPDPMAATIIRLVEEYGVFRTYARQAVMSSDTLDVPKRVDGPTIYYPGEGGAITPSDLTFGQVNLVAKKYAQLSIMSSELNEDSVISMTDLITTEFAWNFAKSEDLNSFLGDGTGTYGGITGISNALQAGSKVTAAAGGWSAVTRLDYEAMVGLMPQYAGVNPRWYVSSYGYYNSMVSLLTGLGGTDMRQLEAGGEMQYLGYPVTFTQVLPKQTTSVGDMLAVFGDLNLGAYSGTRRLVTIKILNELYAASDQIGLVGTMRADSNIHDVGDATDPGCIIGLFQGGP